MAKLIYGTGMRIHECLTLRIKDIDFDLHTVTVRAGKGNKDRTTLRPHTLIPKLTQYLDHIADMSQRLVDLLRPAFPLSRKAKIE